MAKGTVLMMKGDEEVRFDADHPATEFYKHLKDEGCELTVRKQGFKMEEADGSRLGFCVPRKEGYVVYLTTITPDSEALKDSGLEITKGASNLAVAHNLGSPEKALKVLRKVYAAKAKADEAAAESKPKKEKKPKKDDVEASDDKPKKKKDKKNKDKKNRKPKAEDINEAATTVRRKKRSKNKATETEAEAA